EVVVPMVSASSGSGEAEAPSPPAEQVSLWLQRAEQGGVIVSFLSADTGSPMTYHLPDLSMSAAWDSHPLHVCRVGNYAFCMLHAGMVGIPDDNPPLHGRDIAMIAAFEESFQEMDLEVAHQEIRHRAPMDAPAADSGKRRFFRVMAH